MSDKYILDENFNPVPCEDLLEWARWFEENDRELALNYVTDNDDRMIKVSTVFLGLDHSYNIENNHRPILWETMIFGGDHDQYQERYDSKEEALEGHKRAIKRVKDEI